MIRAIARLAVGNPVAANLAMLTLCVAGVLSYGNMPREVFPDFSQGKVEVQTLYPGAAPEDVERLVTTPIEEALEGLPDLEEMVSTSREGVSRVLLTLAPDTDVDTFIADVRNAVSRGDVELPGEVEDPWIREIKTVFPVIAVFVYGWASEGELRDLADRHKRNLEALEGVRQIAVTGLREPRVWIEVDPSALERFALTLAGVGEAVRARAKDAPLGSLATEDGEWLVRVDAGVRGADDLRDLPVLVRPDGSTVRLSQVATVFDTFERPLTRARYNGRPCIHMTVNKKTEGDTIDIARAVHEYVDREQARMPEGTALGTNTDLSIYVRRRLEVMAQSGALGAGLVLLALLSFLSLRVAVVTAIGIPVSFLGGLVIAGAAGVTMNMITMFALIVVLGMIVDDAIVVGENAFRLMEEGYPPEEAAVLGTAQVGRPVIATILTSVVAFLPILILDGTTGMFLRPLPLVVSFCLVVSLFEALTILPAHLAHWGRASAARAGSGRPAARWYGPLRSAYVAFLGVAYRWRYVTIAAALAIAATVGAIGRYWIPLIFFDDFESQLVYVHLRLDPQSSLDDTERVAREIERRMLDLPESELASVNTLVGVSASDTTHYEVAQHLAQVWVELDESGHRTQTTAEVIAEIRRRLADLPPEIESFEIEQPQSGPTGRAIELSIRGPELAVLREISEDVQRSLAGFAGTRDVRDNLDEGKREVRVVLDERGRTLGLSEAGLAAYLRTAFEGTTYAHVRRGRDDVELVLKLPEWVRERRGDLARLRVETPSGARVPLSTVASLVDVIGPSVISHEDRERSVSVVADLDKSEGNATSIALELAARYEDLGERYPGYHLEFKGDYEESQRSLGRLRDAGVIALVLIYLILGTLFRSFAQPFVIMFVIPFAAVGVIAGHLAMGLSIGLMSLIGLLALMGVVVNDSLIMVDFMNQRRKTGEGVARAVVEAGRLRFRPIVLTSVTTMLGLFPLAFFATGQARFLQPMAISIFFGLAVSTVLVLVLVPCAYGILEDGLSVFRRRPAPGDSEGTPA